MTEVFAEVKTVTRPAFEKRDDPKFKAYNGLVVVVVQNNSTEEVLMVAYANVEAVKKTLLTGTATFFTTSRGRLWTKGEESGNYMKVVDILVDCDGDALIYRVEPQGDGVACHTGAKSCFFRSILDPGETFMQAPKAGKDEELATMWAEVHSSLTPKSED